MSWARGRGLPVALGLGIGYGLLSLEAVSPLGIALVLWLGLTLVLAWRLPPTSAALGLAALAFIAGFAIVWTAILAHLALTCNPPICQTPDALTDLFYGAVFISTVFLLGGAETALRLLLRRRAGWFGE